MVQLADGGLDNIAVVPGIPHRLAGGPAGALALGLRNLDAGVFPQAEVGGVLILQVDAQPPPRFVKEDVAGDLEGPPDVDVAVDIHTPGGEGVQAGVHAAAHHVLFRSHLPLRQRRCGDAGLVGGARAVDAPGGPVEVGLRLLL